NCLVGPGVDWATGAGTLVDGYPVPLDTALDGQSMNDTLTVTSPSKKGFASNAYVANFFQSGATGSYPLASAPNAVLGPTDFNSGNPWYEFDCLDGEENYVARIRVMV